MLKFNILNRLAIINLCLSMIILNRTTPKQIEHWAKIGQIMEDNPDLHYEFVKQAIIAQAEREAGKLEVYDFD